MMAEKQQAHDTPYAEMPSCHMMCCLFGKARGKIHVSDLLYTSKSLEKGH